MNRKTLSTLFISAAFLAVFAVSGCKSPTVDYQVAEFATLRVLNFAPSGSNCTPTAPMDVYWSTPNAPQVAGNNANIYNLQYGGSAVYTNQLSVSSGGSKYYITVTPTRIPHETDLDSIPLNLQPGKKYSFIITRDPNNPSNFKDTLIEDANIQLNSLNQTGVRFMNLQPNTGPLTVHVNDPLFGTIINSTPENFNQVSAYTILTTALDTSYTFFVTNSSNQVIARLSNQTFIAGQYYTLVYAGDTCQTTATNLADSLVSGVDTLRLRALDDNSTGNDQTNPIQASFRYNIVNDIFSTGYALNPNPAYDHIGYLVNGEAFPERGNFSVSPLAPYMPGGEGMFPMNSDSTVWNVDYVSTIIPNPLDVKGFATNAGGTLSTQIFDYTVPTKNVSMPNSILPDHSYTVIFYDTIPLRPTQIDTTIRATMVPVPDVAYPDSVTVVFIAGVPNSKGPSGNFTGNKSYTEFYIQRADGSMIQLPHTSGVPVGVGYSMNLPLAPGSSENFTVIDSIGGSAPRISGQNGTPVSFTATAGGIYEVVSEGIRAEPSTLRVLVMHVNAQK